MTETYLNINSVDISSICRVCFSKERVRPMYVDEAQWYQSVVFKPETSSDCKMSVCEHCGHIVRKLLRFISHCQDAHYLLNTVLEQDKNFDFANLQPSLFHNLTTTNTKTYYVGPENLDLNTIPVKTELKYEVPVDNSFINDDDRHDDTFINDDDDEDEKPLVMLQSDEGEKVHKKKKKKRNGPTKTKPPSTSELDPGELELPTELDLPTELELADVEARSGRSVRSGRSKQPREGFTSRMVQETDEYTVIKLTKEQVRSELRRRASSPRFERAPHRCERCVKGFNFEDVLRKHMAKHDPASGSFKCDICEQYCGSAVSLRGHMKSHTTSSVTYQCLLCSSEIIEDTEYYFTDDIGPETTSVLQRHLGNVIPEGGVICSRCFGNVVRDMASSSSNPPETNRYKCKVCGAVRLSRQHLLEHHAISHTGQAAVYRCQHHQCCFTSNKRTVMQRHVRSHVSAARLPCDRCPRAFRTMEALRVHVARHDLSSRPRCDQCGCRFMYASQLATHVKHVHESTDYYCVECDMRFKSKDNLRLHFKKAKRHRDPPRHIESPPDEARPFTCPVCDKAFTRKSVLTVHSRTHARHQT